MSSKRDARSMELKTEEAVLIMSLRQWMKNLAYDLKEEHISLEYRQKCRRHYVPYSIYFDLLDGGKLWK